LCVKKKVNIIPVYGMKAKGERRYSSTHS